MVSTDTTPIFVRGRTAGRRIPPDAVRRRRSRSPHSVAGDRADLIPDVAASIDATGKIHSQIALHAAFSGSSTLRIPSVGCAGRCRLRGRPLPGRRQRLVAGSANGAIHFLNHQGSLIWQNLARHTVPAVGISRDGAVVAAGSYDDNPLRLRARRRPPLAEGGGCADPRARPLR